MGEYLSAVGGGLNDAGVKVSSWCGKVSPPLIYKLYCQLISKKVEQLPYII